MQKVWKNYNLSIVLLILFLSALLIQTLAGWQEFIAEQTAHNEAAQVFGDEGYVWRWAEATFENWQSEFLHLFTMVVLTSFLIHNGSAESRDSQDEMQRKLDAIQQELQALKDEHSQKSSSGKSP